MPSNFDFKPFTGLNMQAHVISVDTMTESTSAAGITADGVLLKDASVLAASGFGNDTAILTFAAGAAGLATLSGRVAVHPGDASAPGYGFSSDPDTGMYLEGVASLGFTVAGTRRMRIAAASVLFDAPIYMGANGIGNNGAVLTFAAGAAGRATFGGGITAGGAVLAPGGSTSPAHSFTYAPTTGIAGASGPDALYLIVGGVTRGTLYTTGLTLNVPLNLVANSITGTSVDINNAELQQLSNIGAATISGTQWGYLGAMNQGVGTGDSVTHAGMSLTGNLLMAANGIGNDASVLTFAAGATGLATFGGGITAGGAVLAPGGTTSPGHSFTLAPTTGIAGSSGPDVLSLVVGGVTRGTLYTTGLTLNVPLNLVANSILGTSVDINNAELQQLSNIGAATISGTQWGYLGAMNQGVGTGDLVAFAGATFNGTVLMSGTNPVQFNDSGTYWYSRANGELDGVFDGSMRLGADVTVNYTEVEADGTLVAHGAATTWEDCYIDFWGAKVPSAPQNRPLEATFLGNVMQYTFDVDDYLSLSSAEIMHAYKEGSDIELHVHWATNGLEGTDKTVKWEIEYTYANQDAADGIGDAFPATTVITAETTIPANTPDRTNMYTSVGTISDAAMSFGVILCVRVRRIASTGTEPTANPFGLMIGAHVEQDTQGSRTVSTK